MTCSLIPLQPFLVCAKPHIFFSLEKKCDGFLWSSFTCGNNHLWNGSSNCYKCDAYSIMNVCLLLPFLWCERARFFSLFSRTFLLSCLLRQSYCLRLFIRKPVSVSFDCALQPGDFMAWTLWLNVLAVIKIWHLIARVLCSDHCDDNR